MCGLAGALSISERPIPNLRARLAVMNDLIAHRGPDGQGTWVGEENRIGLTHRRLAIIDLSEHGQQPMVGNNEKVIAFNGEIYNYREIRKRHESRWTFRSNTDTETVLAAEESDPSGFFDQLRGMFAFALWDPKRRELLLARDRFGIKPLYYATIDDVLYFASEAKALVPFLRGIETDMLAMSEYVTFQFTLGGRTMFDGIHQIEPGHFLRVGQEGTKSYRYWDVEYDVDYGLDENDVHERVRHLLTDSVDHHLTSDVEVGAYASGGVDSSLTSVLASRYGAGPLQLFHGRFADPDGYDESRFAQTVARGIGANLSVSDISVEDFDATIRDVIFSLDHPVAGPGSFPQYMVSRLAAQRVKVVLGGQGGDEVFGGYARYLIAYFEQCIKAAIEGTYKDGRFVVTIESIIPNLGVLQEYVPLLRDFWRDGLFGNIDSRYFRLIDRSRSSSGIFDWEQVDSSAVFEGFSSIFNSRANVRKEALFDSMTHFDFKTLLPALLHVEDRMSMAHGLESRVPFLDHPLIEFVATIPADIKFAGGRMKHLLKTAFHDVIPSEIRDRRDKMGFPVPLNEWLKSGQSTAASDLLSSLSQTVRPGIRSEVVRESSTSSERFSRTSWALLSLEAWYQQFHDRQAWWAGLVDAKAKEVEA